MLSSHPHARDVQERLRGTNSPTLGLKYELRDVGTASPQLCSHIWQGQPFSGSQQMPQAQAALASKPCPCCSAGRGGGLGLLPFSSVGSPGPAGSSGAQIWLQALALGHRAGERAGSTHSRARAGPKPLALEPLLQPWCQNHRGFAIWEEGRRLLLPQNLPLAP